MRTFNCLNIRAVLLSTALLCLFSVTASANSTLNGIAVHTELGKEKFLSALYLPNLTSSAEDIFAQSGPQKMEIRVLDEQLSSRRFKRMWIEGIAINANSAELQKQARNMAAFSNQLNVKLKKNDILAFEKKSRGIDITLNSIKIGNLADPSFFNFLLRTWIGYVPLSSSFRDNLLAAGSIDLNTLQRYESIQPSSQRVATLKSAIQARQEQERQAEAEAARKAEEARLAALATPTPTPVIKKKAPKATPKPTATPPPRNIASLPKPGSLDDSIIYNTASAPAANTSTASLAKPTSLDESIFDNTEESENLTAENLLSEQLYYSHLASYTQTFARYPRRAQDNEQTGSLLLRVTIDRKGNVLKKDIVETTPHELLNKEALRAVDRASPYPPIPTDIQGAEFTFSFRLTFNLKDG